MAAFMPIRAKKQYRIRTNCSEGDFHKLYRFNEDNVEWITDHFLGYLNETRGGAISNKKKMQIFLRFLSDPGFQAGIGKEEGVHRSTVCKTVNFVLEKVSEKAHLWIKFPTDNLHGSQQEWACKYQFPCAIGAIDCTHIRISKPWFHADEYINRKGFCSINVQATCNVNEEFTSIDAQWPGSVHDSRVLRRSRLYDIMNRQRSNAVLLGDVGYGLHSWLVTPYKNPQTPQEIAYNKLLSKERVIIERCFGQLKQRFSILQYKVRVDLHKVCKVITCCVVMHNVAKYLKDMLPNEEDFNVDYSRPNTENNNLNEVPVSDDEEHDNGVSNGNQYLLGQQRREELKNVIFSIQNRPQL